MRAYERFLNYVVVHTTSDDTSTTVPSSQCQFDLANLLVDEMKEMGIEDAHVDEKCYVYGTIPATPGYEEVPALGFCAHLDTAAFNGKNVKPRVIENYDGKDVTLGDSGRTLTVEQFPHLASMKGKTLIVTDGTTLLGGDDKAGIAEIMTLAERLMKGEISHGKICLSFPPDEEIGEMCIRDSSKGGFHLARLGYGITFNDAIGYYQLFGTNGNFEYSGWSDANYDKLVEQASTMQNGPERDKVLEEIEQIMYSENGFSVCPLYYASYVYCMKDLQNTFYSAISNLTYFGYATK